MSRYGQWDRTELHLVTFTHIYTHTGVHVHVHDRTIHIDGHVYRLADTRIYFYDPACLWLTLVGTHVQGEVVRT